MTLDELRALLSPDRLDEIAAHNCGASEVALGLASALVHALIERDTLRAEVERLTAERDERGIVGLDITTCEWYAVPRGVLSAERAQAGFGVAEFFRCLSVWTLRSERDARPAITREDARLRSERFDLGLGAESMSDEMRRAEDRVDAALRAHAKGGE